MGRLVRAYWWFLKSKIALRKTVFGRGIEMQFQCIPWLLPLLFVGVLGLAGVRQHYINDLLIVAAAITFAGFLFVGSAAAVVQINRSCGDQTSTD